MERLIKLIVGVAAAMIITYMAMKDSIIQSRTRTSNGKIFSIDFFRKPSKKNSVHKIVITTIIKKITIH